MTVIARFRLVLSTVAVAGATSLAAAPLAAQGARPAQAPVLPERPIPERVVPPAEFQRAIERGTRTADGRPGPNYWQQRADYTIRASVDPRTGRLTGEATIGYTNNSPDTLPFVFVHLRPNLFAPNAMRNRMVPVTEAVTLSRVAVGGQALQASGQNPSLRLGQPPMPPREPGYTVGGTVMAVRLPQPLLPGAKVSLDVAWSYIVPPEGAPRGGRLDSTFYVSYWYPQMAVYDDVYGWHADQYLGNAEFYMGYGDYDVSLTVPEGWLVAATGTLQNPTEVLSRRTQERLARARRTRDIVRVVDERERGAGDRLATADAREGTLTWRFRAENVRDFAWGASSQWLWDATHAVIGDRDGNGRPDTAAIYSFWRPEGRAHAWAENNRYVRHSVEFLSQYLWPYAYPQMTAVHGPNSCGGMEYPMMTCIGGARDSISMYGVTVHETAHMWFPMNVGSNEKWHSWQDEGLTSFNEAQASRDFFKGAVNDEKSDREGYLSLARTGAEVELMRHGDLYPNYAAFARASYSKMATIMQTLRGLLGEETFHRAYREYGRRWLNRHPTPWDMWNTFENVAQRDLDWFWTTWFYETWPLDQAIAAVDTAGGAAAGDSLAITIEDRGLAPMPVRLAITRRDGKVERREVPVNVWLQGARRHTVRVPGRATVAEVAIDPEELFPDADRTNQVWRAGGASGAGAAGAAGATNR